jgi:preprotein translocase subunit YajC
MFFEGIAWGQDAAKAGPVGQEVLFTTIIPLAALFGIFYFLIIRPQVKKASEHTKLIGALKRNDEVVTMGGLIGRITEVGEKIVTLEIAPNVRVRVERPQISALSTYGKAASGKKEKAEG